MCVCVPQNFNTTRVLMPMLCMHACMHVYVWVYFSQHYKSPDAHVMQAYIHVCKCVGMFLTAL